MDDDFDDKIIAKAIENNPKKARLQQAYDEGRIPEKMYEKNMERLLNESK